MRCYPLKLPIIALENSEFAGQTNVVVNTWEKWPGDEPRYIRRHVAYSLYQSTRSAAVIVVILVSIQRPKQIYVRRGMPINNNSARYTWQFNWKWCMPFASVWHKCVLCVLSINDFLGFVQLAHTFHPFDGVRKWQRQLEHAVVIRQMPQNGNEEKNGEKNNIIKTCEELNRTDVGLCDVTRELSLRNGTQAHVSRWRRYTRHFIYTCFVGRKAEILFAFAIWPPNFRRNKVAHAHAHAP